MSAKEIVMKTIRKMSDKMSMDEIFEELAILAAIQRGEEAADAVKIISHDELVASIAGQDNLSDLEAAAGSSVAFWDNPLDDEDWNDA